MDTRQRRSKSALSELHEHAGSLPPSARPKAFDQSRCSTKYNVQQNIRIIENRWKILGCVLPNAESAVHPW